jgi:hypothetical protein
MGAALLRARGQKHAAPLSERSIRPEVLGQDARASTLSKLAAEFGPLTVPLPEEQATTD